jgi:hypothetical protein
VVLKKAQRYENYAISGGMVWRTLGSAAFSVRQLYPRRRRIERSRQHPEENPMDILDFLSKKDPKAPAPKGSTLTRGHGRIFPKTYPKP